MRKYIFLMWLVFTTTFCYSQNLIVNSGFENLGGKVPQVLQTIDFTETFTAQNDTNGYWIQDWIRVSQSPDVFRLGDANGIPLNSFHSDYIYPHSDSTFVGGFQYFHGAGGG